MTKQDASNTEGKTDKQLRLQNYQSKFRDDESSDSDLQDVVPKIRERSPAIMRSSVEEEKQRIDNANKNGRSFRGQDAVLPFPTMPARLNQPVHQSTSVIDAANRPLTQRENIPNLPSRSNTRQALTTSVFMNQPSFRQSQNQLNISTRPQSNLGYHRILPQYRGNQQSMARKASKQRVQPNPSNNSMNIAGGEENIASSHAPLTSANLFRGTNNQLQVNQNANNLSDMMKASNIHYYKKGAEHAVNKVQSILDDLKNEINMLSGNNVSNDQQSQQTHPAQTYATSNQSSLNVPPSMQLHKKRSRQEFTGDNQDQEQDAGQSLVQPQTQKRLKKNMPTQNVFDAFEAKYNNVIDKGQQQTLSHAFGNMGIQEKSYGNRSSAMKSAAKNHRSSQFHTDESHEEDTPSKDEEIKLQAIPQSKSIPPARLPIQDKDENDDNSSSLSLQFGKLEQQYALSFQDLNNLQLFDYEQPLQDDDRRQDQLFNSGGDQAQRQVQIPQRRIQKNHQMQQSLSQQQRNQTGMNYRQSKQ
eukprot:403359537